MSYKQIMIGGAVITVPDEPEVTPSIDDLKVLKNAYINTKRLSANYSTFPFSGKQIACDQLSRGDIDAVNGFVALYGVLPPGWPGEWKSVDGTYISIPDLATWKSFYSAMFAQGNANFAKAQALKSQLSAAESSEQIDAVVW